MKLRLAILFFLIILPGFSISQNIDSLKVQKWLEDNTIYEGCENCLLLQALNLKCLVQNKNNHIHK